MSRDHRKLEVFHLADELTVEVYQNTKSFPIEERFGLQSQIRRAAVSATANIVEGCSRSTTKDYLHFMTISLGSASEARYLIDLSFRLGFLPQDHRDGLESRHAQLVRMTQKLIDSLKRRN